MERPLSGVVLYSALHDAFDGPQGSIVLAWLKQKVGYGRVRVTEGDTHLTYLALGEQNIVNQIIAMLAVPVEAWETPERQPEEDWLFKKGTQ